MEDVKVHLYPTSAEIVVRSGDAPKIEAPTGLRTILVAGALMFRSLPRKRESRKPRN